MGSGPTKTGGFEPGFLSNHANGNLAGGSELAPKAVAKRQALEKITTLLGNQEALDALCRDLFESMSSDEGGRSISRSRLRMLTRLVINSCQVSDPSSLQELLDVLVPLHSRLTEGEEDVPQMGYDGFLPHARCVLRVIDAVLQVELDGDEGELKGVDAFQTTFQDLAVLQHSGNGEACEVPLTSSRRNLVDDRAVIITAEDLRDAHGSVSVAAAVVEATMPDSVVPGHLDTESDAIIQDVVGVETNASVTAGRGSPVVSGEAQMLATSSRPLPAASPRTATPPLSIRPPQLVSLASTMAAHSFSFGSSMVASSSCTSLGGSLPTKSLRPSLSCASLGYSVEWSATVSAGMLPQDKGSTSRAPMPSGCHSVRSATPTGGATASASVDGVGSLPTSRSTTPRSVVRRSVGLSRSLRAPCHPRQCSPQGRADCVPVAMTINSSTITALPELHALNGAARSQSPTRPSAGACGRGCIRTPVGPLCITPVTARMPQLSGSMSPVSLPLNPVLALAGSSCRSTSPLRPPSQLRASDVYYAMTTSYATSSGM